MRFVMAWLVEICLTLFVVAVLASWSLRYSNKNDMAKILKSRWWWWGLGVVWMGCSVGVLGWTAWRM